MSRHALITGAGRGIGAAITQRLAADGLRLTLTGRDAAALRSVADRLPTDTLAVAGDVSDPAQVAAVFAAARARFGPVQVLINNAGQAATAALHKTDDALWARMLAVNLTGTFLCTRDALADMRAAGRGRIINIASTAGQRGYAYCAAYAAAKHGVVGLTRSLAMEVARTGITVNAVCPGFTDTDIVASAVQHIVQTTGRSPEQAQAELTRHNPQGRLVSPREVADTVAWLCSDGAQSVHGQCLSISGGEVM